jgi:hypothetical protein
MTAAIDPTHHQALEHAVAELMAVVDAVRGLHVAGRRAIGPRRYCVDCGRLYPCPTVEALDRGGQ